MYYNTVRMQCNSDVSREDGVTTATDSPRATCRVAACQHVSQCVVYCTDLIIITM